jgi:hypothetical protein
LNYSSARQRRSASAGRRWWRRDAASNRTEDLNVKVCEETPEKAGQRAVARRPVHARPGTVLGREWNGQMQRVTVLENGFAWKGKIYPSLSKIALAIIANRYRNAPTKRTHVYKFKSIRDARTAIRDTFVERREASSKQGIIDRLTKWPKAV